ncbi:DUF2399 domain-containing protein [Actinomadura barringtoniae]|uniref:DUF2399 domain-containing protein n=1 Tax=Actinomadura barringtoniae TaxID=1427535 RepID=A0A939PEM8_9ACTN|nr:DUF2399 domain-containing protein [Actinomadura barringtoniae]MBO2451211.1 DUF2399 domain-containing protein [Actinomadura barringtoniae]
MRPETRAWLGQPALARLWDLLRDRVERSGLEVRGRIRLDMLSADEVEALGLLMGRSYPGGTVSIALADLDERLRLSAAEVGLIDVVAELRGPLTNRPALRNARRAAAEATWAEARKALRRNDLDQADWAESWLAELKRSGVLARLPSERAAQLMVQAVDVLAALPHQLESAPSTMSPRPEPGEFPSATDLWSTARAVPAIRLARLGRGELAEQLTGTAHGLDDDTLLSKVVMRALARAHGIDPPPDAAARRALWEAAGVATDRVSSTVLTYGLVPLGGHWPERSLRERTEACAETHLTLRDLQRITWRLAADTEIYICENPRIIEAAVEARCSRPVVCASGNPTTTVLTLLDALDDAGARLAYRGDFDWPGIAMANRMIARYDAHPWRMSSADYEEHVATARDRGTPLLPLGGNAVEAGWDPELTPTMCSLEVAVQEESALELLLSDLR